MIFLKNLFIKKSYKATDPFWQDERKVYEIKVKNSKKNKKKDDNYEIKNEFEEYVKIGRGLVYSSDYQKIFNLAKKIFPIDNPPFFLISKDKTDEKILIKNKKNLLKHLMEEGKKGVSIQRYKGLGEMNPEQLWETTMNPEKRMLMKVKVNDIFETDSMFSLLMGEDVEPRREFIQNNALDVRSLDI